MATPSKSFIENGKWLFRSNPQKFLKTGSIKFWKFKPVFYERYVDDIFVLFRKEEQLQLFPNYFNSCHENIKFTSEKESNNKLSFLDIEISRDKNQPTFSGVFSYFDSFIPRVYKFNLVLTLIFCFYSICCGMELFHMEII